MSYIPSEWSDGNEVTSAKLNNLESGVTAVGYEPTTWKAGDVVTAEKLNHLEQGVADSDQLTSLMNGTVTEFTITEEMKRENNFNGYKYLGIGFSYPLSFSDCKDLETINGLSLVDIVKGYAFTGCVKLKNLCIPNAVTVGDSNYSLSVLGGSGVETISLDSVTAIYDGVSSGASNLEYVYLPKAVTIGSSIQGCSKLKHVYIGADCTSINAGCFGGSGGQSTGLIIDCGFAEGAVSGAPWAASNATINYNVPDPGSIEAMIEGES